MKFTTKATIRMSSDVVTRVHGASVSMIENVGHRLLSETRSRVSPGVGPGPHPHVTQHVDTGWLRDHIFLTGVVHESRRHGVVNGVVTDVEYAKYLEIGWHSSKGNFFKYPFMLPAVSAIRQWAIQEAARLFRLAGKRRAPNVGGLLSIDSPK